MSYLDVQVLRRFTQKLANATMGAETWATPGAFRTDFKEKGMYENYAEPALNAVSNTGAAAAAKIRHLTGNEMDVTPATMRGSVGDNAHITGAPTVSERLTGAHEHLKGTLGDSAKYLPDLQTLGYGAGGALLGGAGAMGLAHLLRSEEEKKKGPSLLAGLGGAAAGSVALPLLMQYLAGGTAPEAGAAATAMGTKPITLNTNPGLTG
jgi:hypothetical protein